MILLGIDEGTNFQALKTINGNISRIINVEKGCRQGDPILGYQCIVAIEIVTLQLKKSKIKPYKCKARYSQLLDIHADDLSIYLEFNKSNKIVNEKNVQEALTAIETFYKWSGLKVNRGKTP